MVNDWGWIKMFFVIKIKKLISKCICWLIRDEVEWLIVCMLELIKLVVIFVLVIGLCCFNIIDLEW